MSKKVDRFQEMENERNSRMMVLMTALKDYIGCVTTEINELRNLANVGLPAVKLPGEQEKPKKPKKTKKKKVEPKVLEKVEKDVETI